MTRALARAAAIGAMAVLAFGQHASADQWNERTTMKFSEPVMIPGTTLQPGTYVFMLADSDSARHIVQVFTEDQQKIVATVQAVPAKRQDVKGDIVLKFNPTEAGSPPAIKAWYYPGSTYGHEFVYSEDEARTIAQRTKTVVLSTDVPGSDLNKGTLHTFDEAGARAAWKGDGGTMAEWDTWQRGRARAAGATAPGGRQSEASAAMVQGDVKGTRVTIDDLEDDPDKYKGKTISVDAEVEDVYGPRLFTIGEPNWGVLSGEMLVFMPTHLAALVKEDDRITVTGTVRPFVRAEVEREWGWFGLDPEVEVEFARKPVLVAERIVGGSDQVVMVIEIGESERPVGTAGAAAAASPVTDLGSALDRDMIGRHVDLKQLEVTGTAQGGGFFVKHDDAHVLVLPAHTGQTAKSGETVALSGVILRMPRGMQERLKAPGDVHDDVYLYATSIQR